MIPRLHPHLVGPLDALAEVPPGVGFEPAARGWVTQDRTVPGHIGNPASPPRRRGEALFRVFSEDVVALLERMLRWNGKDWNG